jgi:hypothetical protein
MTDGGVAPERKKWLSLGCFLNEILHKKWQYHLLNMISEVLGPKIKQDNKYGVSLSPGSNEIQQGIKPARRAICSILFLGKIEKMGLPRNPVEADGKTSLVVEQYKRLWKEILGRGDAL